ncbi:MAG: PaaI family thioesterase [Gallionella sp.]
MLNRTAFLKPYGFIVHACGLGECALRVPFSTKLERPGGIVSGMTIMGAADVGIWLAIMTHRGTEEQWVTSDMKTAFLRSGRNEELLCTARILKLGKRTACGTVETLGSSTGLLAHHVLTYAKVNT